MKRNIIHKILISAAVLFCLNSCTNLDTIWYDKVTPETFYKSQKEVYSAMNRPFTHFNWYMGYERWLAQEVTADQFSIVTKGVNFGGDWERVHHHEWNANTGIVTSGWGGTTMGVSLCLDVMQDLEKVDYESIGFTEDDRTAHISQLKTLIAYFYMRGLDFFGGMPIYEKIEGEGIKARNTDQETFDHIEKLLKEAITKLPIKNPVIPLDGTIYRGAAAAILAELYFNAEAYIGKSMYSECAQICQEILDKKYGDYDYDKTWFGPHGFDNNKSSEVMWVNPSERTKQEYNWFYAYHYHSLGRLFFGGDLGGAMNATSMQPSLKPTGEAYGFKLGKPYAKFNDKDLRKKLYKYESSGRYEGMFIIGDFKTPEGMPILGLEEYANQPLYFVDKVARFSEVGPGKKYASISELPSTIKDGEENTGVRLVKVPIPTDTDLTYRWAPDRPIIRLTEIYYMLAECKWRAGDKGGAASLINIIRARNFENGADPDPCTANNLDEWRFLDEWGTEFLGEGRRRTDLIRWGKYVTAEWWDHKPTNDKNLNRFPVPEQAISGNNLIKQNPGYSN